MNLIEYLKSDEELKQMRKEWKMKFAEGFPPYNYDEYHGIDDYKQKIRTMLKSGKYVYKTASKFHDILDQNK